MPRQWIAALLWLTNCRIILSCITVHCRLAGRTNSIGLESYIPKIHVCVSVRLCARGSVAVIQIWRSCRNMSHSTGNLTERSGPNLHDGARAEKQKAGTRAKHILLWCLRICRQSLAEMPFSTFKAFARRESEWTRVSYNTFPRGAGGKPLSRGFFSSTWWVSNILQLFSYKVIHLPKNHTSISSHTT